MSKFILPEDVDLQTALNMLAIFKKSVNELVILHNVITPEGRVLVKGDAIHNLLVEIINCEKLLKADLGIGVEHD
jgi:hypothetical protein